METSNRTMHVKSLPITSPISLPKVELWPILGDGVYQAAYLDLGATSISSRNLTPLMTFGNWF